MLLGSPQHENLFEFLQDALTGGGRLACASGDFSLFAWDTLQEKLRTLSTVRLLIPAASSLNIDGQEFDRHLRNKLQTQAIAQQCLDWLQSGIVSVRQCAHLPANLYLMSQGDAPAIAVHGSTPLTTDGLGLSVNHAVHVSTCSSQQEEVARLSQHFEMLWESASDAPTALQDILTPFARQYTPEHIYYAMLNTLFEHMQSDLDANTLNQRTGIKDTTIWNKLYRFQRDAVLGIIEKMERFGGCILADSVGLGKTFEALAVIKYYELRNDRVLVLCPKKLRENWALYTVNDKRNILVGDRFGYDVLHHTDLTRMSGYSAEINLSSINWGNYDLVVIDESHNFRNAPSNTKGLTRYSRLMQDIIKSGVKTRVLLLSATPVNNRMTDLKNQISIIVEGKDGALRTHGIVSLERTLQRAQSRFNRWQDLPEVQRTQKTLIATLGFDYFKLLDMLTLARSRKHIQKYYDMAETGQFPTRLAPHNIKTTIDATGVFPTLDKINTEVRRLNLSAYTPLKYVRPEMQNKYSEMYDMQLSGGSVFRQIDREASLIHLMRVNLFKRMESSIHSFADTVERLLGEVRSLLQRLDQADAEYTDTTELPDADTLALDDAALEEMLVGKKIRVHMADTDRTRWRQELEEDEASLATMLQHARAVTPAHDAKLAALRGLVEQKVRQPFNAKNKKTIIFTAFADTADYLYGHLAPWAASELGIHTALITGGSGNSTNKSTLHLRRKDVQSLLAAFSPVSKERHLLEPDAKGEIDLLIATDCISEGQNLQDCDLLINYDIHWNPVRVIQRFGRVDRLGSRNQCIQLVNFWPNMELEEYIRLESRVSGKMVLLDISATGEENLFEPTAAEEMNDLQYRRQQLEQLQQRVLDMEELVGGIAITDLTLTDFRTELINYRKQLEECGTTLDNMPRGSFAVVCREEVDTSIAPGVFFCLCDTQNVSKQDESYPLAPYYMAYVTEEGEVPLPHTQVRQLLDALRGMCITGSTVSEKALQRWNKRTRKGRHTESYTHLLAKAVRELSGVEEERRVLSLFRSGSSIPSRSGIQGINTVEVLSYLVVL